MANLKGRKDMKQFNVGKEYSTRSTCDHDCIFSFTILRRTAKSVWIKAHNRIVRRHIEVYEDMETFYPFGHYSMCPIIRA